MRPRTIRAAKPCRGPTFEERPKFGLHADIGSIEQLTARHHDDVNTTVRLVVAEKLSYQSLSPVTLDRVPELPGGGNSKPRGRAFSRTSENGHEAAARLVTALVGNLEVCPAPNVFAGTESPVHCRGLAASSFVGNGQALPPFCPPPLQHLLATFCFHANQKPVGAPPAPVVRLKRTFSLRHRLGPRRISDCTRPSSEV